MKPTLSFSKLLSIAAIGGGLEMYDFVIYIYLVPYLAPLFFVSSSPFLSSMAAFAVFALGYFVRPLGGIIMGHFGDRIGRKKTFIASILLMSLPILGMGLLPTPHTIGLTATVLFIALRMLQGLAVGGEIPGAMAFVCEHASPHRRGFASGSIYCGLNFGICTAALVIAILSSLFSTTQMAAFGWRIPFILGAFLGFVAVYLRRKTDESPLFLAIQQQKKLEQVPLLSVLQHPASLLRGIGVTALGATMVLLGFTYMSSFLTKELHYPHTIIWAVVAAVFISSCLQIYCGALSDRKGRIPLLKWASLLSLILAFPIYFALSTHTALGLTLGMLGFVLLAAVIIGIYPCFLIELFPTSIRYSGYALSYNIGFAIFGGFAPLFSSYMIHTTGSTLSPALWLILASLLSFISLLGLKDQHLGSLT